MLRPGLQSVRQLKQSLLIVNNVKVVHAGSHVRVVALGNFASWEKPETDQNTDDQIYCIFTLSCYDKSICCFRPHVATVVVRNLHTVT